MYDNKQMIMDSINSRNIEDSYNKIMTKSELIGKYFNKDFREAYKDNMSSNRYCKSTINRENSYMEQL